MASITAQFLKLTSFNSQTYQRINSADFKLFNNGVEVDKTGFTFTNFNSAVAQTSAEYKIAFNKSVTFDSYSFAPVGSAVITGFVVSSSNTNDLFNSYSQIDFRHSLPHSNTPVLYDIPATLNQTVSGFTQSDIDSAVSAAVSNATTGLFTQSQLDSAVASALAGVSSLSLESTAILDNLSGVDVSSTTNTVTFSKLKADYTALQSDKKIVGNALDNKIVGGNNALNVSAGDGNDSVDAGSGNDTLSGGKGNDTLNGGLGNDKLDGGDGNDVINAGDGFNTITGGKGADSIIAGSGNDKIDGGDDNDTINAGDGLNTITGGKGADSIIAGSGNDKIDGGDDNDTINAGDGLNTITGGKGDDTIIAGAGNDKIDGGAGFDRLIGGLGNDTLTGGADSDLFVLSLSGGVDTITDFKSTIDKLVMTDSLTPVALDASNFVTSTTNSFTFTASNSYGFNTKTGALFHDADGAGGVDAVQIALLGKVPLVAADILI
jgi:Ca2+-binding RTX toxin-like protein